MRNVQLEELTPRSDLQRKKKAARALQSAFRRRRWKKLLGAVGQGVGGCFRCFGGDTATRRFRPLVDAKGQITGVRGPSGRWYVDHAFGFLHPLNPLRSIVIILVEASWFDALIILVIFVNCFTLAVEGRPEESFFHLPDALIEQIEYSCTWICARAHTHTLRFFFINNAPTHPRTLALFLPFS